MPLHIARSALVDSRACLHDDAEIGPGCVIGPEVQIGRGTRLASNVCLLGAVCLGEYNTIGSFVAIGGDPQESSVQHTTSGVEIGDHNRFADRVTIHRGTEKGDGLTRIGSHNRFDDGSHVAHDCRLADHVSIGIDTMLAGHVHVGSNVTIAQKVGVHQHVTVGTGSHVGGHSKITRDVPCFMRVEGNPPVVRGINGQDLKVRGCSSESLGALNEAHRLIFVVRKSLVQAATELDDRNLLTPEVLKLLKFLEVQQEGSLGRGRYRRKLG